MRKLIPLILAILLALSIALPAFAEDDITRISTILDIDEPAGMAYVSENTGFCDLFPMDCNLGTHEKGTETYWAIWDILGSTPLYPVEIAEGELASANMRYQLPEKDKSPYGFKVFMSDEDYIDISMYEGWNLFYIIIQNGEETTEMGWYMTMNRADIDILEAVGAVWEGIAWEVGN